MNSPLWRCRPALLAVVALLLAGMIGGGPPATAARPPPAAPVGGRTGPDAGVLARAGAPEAGGPAAPLLCTLPDYSDVPPSNPFYSYIRCLACNGIISPPPGPFNPSNPITRGQTSKLIALAANYPLTAPPAGFTDEGIYAPYIDALYAHGVISGYTSGNPPCPGVLPLFCPGNDVTRGQFAKFVAIAKGYTGGSPTFTDEGTVFFTYIEQVAAAGVVSGYSTSPPCTTGVPCFLPGNNITRAQAAKVVANAFFPGCMPLAR